MSTLNFEFQVFIHVSPAFFDTDTSQILNTQTSYQIAFASNISLPVPYIVTFRDTV